MFISPYHATVALVFTILSCSPGPASAQDPALAGSDLKYSRAMFEGNHLIAQVALEIQQDKYIRFQYEHYPNLEKIVTAEGEEFSRAKGEPWLKTNDFWKTGNPVKRQKSNVLDTYVKIVYLPFANFTANNPELSEKKQPVEVWKFVERKDLFVYDLFTYERSSEHPNPEGAYPLYRFMKYPNDRDGSLLLTDLTGPMADGVNVLPLIVNYQLLYLPPASPIKTGGKPHRTQESGTQSHPTP